MQKRKKCAESFFETGKATSFQGQHPKNSHELHVILRTKSEESNYH